ncbi:nucleotide exchange factor GrpE [Cellulomonas chengniuliangii]|uniref:Protein GrpE n=1 Tax=Cellulomonas chengniuliangii TaxID=2968084 RepID=A0ABY5L100_9CELL|nr:nucleotide exchange factor GrpE [Cellulomonas chengniuliangii]MCC2309290.1 nucleotide exchange factor GrpE [Cellulomonas chengniuliangii]MCC2316552.1 nucleotide exchange factor GrpE [Cellulomonas chengniuliangii]UUI75141.1 nucleotide exchange factor GrpE [Cellulomonas chengniuliangii]
MSEDRTPAGGEGRPDPSGEETPRFTDKRRIDPETGAVRDQGAQPEGAEADPLAGLEAEADAHMHEALVAAEGLAAERLDELQRANAAYYNLEQQYTSYVKRSKSDASVARERGVAEVAEALIPVLDDIQLARQHGDLTGPFGSIAEKLEAILGRFGIVRYGAEGEVFDPNVHEALMHSHSSEVAEPTVATVLQPGYRAGERILRAARVAVVDPDA